MVRLLTFILLSVSQLYSARIYTTGFEANHLGTNSTEKVPSGTGVSIVSTGGRVQSGTYALQVTFGNSATASTQIDFSTSAATGYYRIGIQIDALPDGDMVLGRIDFHDTHEMELVVSSTGKLKLKLDNTTTYVTTTGSIAADTYYPVLIKAKYATSGAIHELIALGETLTDNTNNAGTANCDNFVCGNTNGGVLANTIWYDDIAFDDAAYPSARGKVIFLMPTSDNRRGNWTGGGGGTTNLFEGVNNKPPTGNTTDADASQVKDVNASTTDSLYFNVTDYSTAGLASGDTLYVVQPVIRTSEHSATGTKTGSVGVYSNPAIAGLAFNFDVSSGVHGTEISNWKTTYGTVSASPSVTLGTSPVIFMVKTSNQTTGHEADFFALMVDYSVYVAPTASNTRRRVF